MKKQLLYFSMVGMLLTMNACDDDGKLNSWMIILQSCILQIVGYKM